MIMCLLMYKSPTLVAQIPTTACLMITQWDFSFGLPLGRHLFHIVGPFLSYNVSTTLRIRGGWDPAVQGGNGYTEIMSDITRGDSIGQQFLR